MPDELTPNQWVKLEISVPDFPAEDLAELISKIKEFVNALATTLDLLLQILQTIADPLAAAIRELVDRLRQNVESFLEDLGIYLLYVPIRKRLMTNLMIGGDSLGDITPPIATDLGIFAQPQSAIDPNDPGVTEFMVNTNRMNGGNSGFFSTVVESLYDKGDLSRPQFTSKDDYIAGMTWVMGTNIDLFGFLDDIQRLRELFGFAVRAGTGLTLPQPTGLKGRVLAEPVNGKVDVYLDWNPVEVPISKLPDLGGLSVYPKTIAILRIRDDVSLLKARAIKDIMGEQKMEVGQEHGPAEVIYVDTYSTFQHTSYIDKGVSVAQDETLYYAVAWQLQVLTEGGEEDTSTIDPTKYWQVSDVVRVVPEPVIPDSSPPNWNRVPSIADMFPSFARFLRLVVAQLDNIAGRFAGSLEILSTYVAFLRSEVDRYEALTNRILDLLAQISLQFRLPTAGVYGRMWYGRGGNTFFLTDLANSLSSTYPDAPPFHEGDEFVTGVVMLAGGPAPDVTKFRDGIELFFGAMGEDLTNLVGRIDAQIEQIEDIEFLDDLSLGEVEVTDDFTEDFTSVVECPCDPVDAVQTAFNPDFSVA
jgi:hypothetical protein